MNDKNEEKQCADDKEIMHISEKLIEQNLEAYKELANEKIHRRFSNERNSKNAEGTV